MTTTQIVFFAEFANNSSPTHVCITRLSGSVILEVDLEEHLTWSVVCPLVNLITSKCREVYTWDGDQLRLKNAGVVFNPNVKFIPWREEGVGLEFW